MIWHIVNLFSLYKFEEWGHFLQVYLVQVDSLDINKEIKERSDWSVNEQVNARTQAKLDTKILVVLRRSPSLISLSACSNLG